MIKYTSLLKINERQRNYVFFFCRQKGFCKYWFAKRFGRFLQTDRLYKHEGKRGIYRKKARMEQGKAQTFEELLAMGRAKGYKNPAFWAQQVMRGRRR